MDRRMDGWKHGTDGNADRRAEVSHAKGHINIGWSETGNRTSILGYMWLVGVQLHGDLLQRLFRGDAGFVEPGDYLLSGCKGTGIGLEQTIVELKESRKHPPGEGGPKRESIKLVGSATKRQWNGRLPGIQSVGISCRNMPPSDCYLGDLLHVYPNPDV